MENGEGEREIYCTWDIILQLGKEERGMDTTTERWTRRWRFRPSSELRWGVVLQTRTIFSGLVQSLNTDCGAMELAHWGWGVKWKWEEVERGKWEEGNFWGKKFRRSEVYQVSASTVITTLSADGTMHWSKGPTEVAYLRNCHWVMDDQIWKQVKSVFSFGLHHSVFWVIESPK